MHELPGSAAPTKARWRLLARACDAAEMRLEEIADFGFGAKDIHEEAGPMIGRLLAHADHSPQLLLKPASAAMKLVEVVVRIEAGDRSGHPPIVAEIR